MTHDIFVLLLLCIFLLQMIEQTIDEDSQTAPLATDENLSKTEGSENQSTQVCKLLFMFLCKM